MQGWVQVAGQDQGQDHGLRLRKVLYEPPQQRAAVDSLLRHLVPILEADPHSDERRAAVASHLVDGLVDFAACCKHPAFAEEKEWRIVYDRSSDPDPLALHHRAGRGLLVPYVKLKLPSPVGVLAGHLPLMAINSGPSPDPHLKGDGLRSLLTQHEHFTDVHVRGSQTPLRL